MPKEIRKDLLSLSVFVRKTTLDIQLANNFTDNIYYTPGLKGLQVTAAHEFFHATICWGRRIGFNWQRLDAEDSVNDDEERLAYVHGALCREFVDRAYASGLY